ncbi:Auxin-induced protein 6B [Dendrobium catenatum]|uniref:Auxin-induced protein 6B n=1 Tax=Dendrobium catenatum TaxID=906689 RepID=A0A2I0W9F4_9ASPA|nr:Auxin-induced protein 6B [Dendrobium catenatum]
MLERGIFSSGCLPWGKDAQTGYAGVYVGFERRRFEMPARYFNLPVIAGLLEKAEEDFGGQQPAGGLLLPCEPVFFQWILDRLAGDDRRFFRLGLPAFRKLFADLGEDVDSI